jgi:hypothetical protein
MAIRFWKQNRTMELLIDVAGHALRVGKRDVSIAVSTLGFVHIRVVERTLIVTLQPGLVHPLTIAAAAYKVADSDPKRTIIIAGYGSQECWVFAGYSSALVKMSGFASDERRAGAPIQEPAVKHHG